jgi:HlyD family secretion protein
MNKILTIKTWVIAHKILSAVIAVALLGSGYGIYSHYSSTASQTKYVLGTVKKGTLLTSVTGTGQVAASEQTNITPNVSGDEITAILVKAGDEVEKGQALAYIKSGDAVKAVANAELALENAKLEYEKATKESNTQAANSDTSDLKKSYESGYNAIANAFIDLPAIFSGVSDIYYVPSRSPYFSDNNINTQGGSVAVAYKYQAGITFDKAKKEYDTVFAAYKSLSADSAPEKISAMLTSTKSILKQLLAALSGTYSTIEYVNNKYTATPPSEITTDKTQLSGFINKVNSNSTSAENALNAIENAKDSTATSDLNMRSSELSQSKASDALRDAQVALADHTIRAPFSGLIAKVSGKVGDKASLNTAIAIIISKAKLVNITLNEIDAAKVHVGDKATLTFDALEDLKLSAHVSNIDLVGTVSQGVVSYSVEIAFDENDDRVKPGMTVNADITANSKADVLLVPSSAIKTVGGKSFVQVLPTVYPQGPAMKAGVTSSVAPTNKPVTIGASNDTSVEIISGVVEGDQIVTKTVVGTATTAAAPNILSSLGGNRSGAAGATRAITR